MRARRSIGGTLGSAFLARSIAALMVTLPFTVWAAEVAPQSSSADTTSRQGAPGAGSVTPAAPTATAATPLPAASKTPRDPAKFKRFDDLREPMLTTKFPGTIDTITGDAGGWRSWLADRDIGTEIDIATIGSIPLRGTGAPRDPQVYNGQRATLQTHSLVGKVVIGLNGIDLPNTAILIGGGYYVTTFDPNGPTKADFKELALYQSFANKTVEIKVGFVENYLEYVGLTAGGNITLTNGLSSLVPVEVGLSAEPGPTPTINFAFNGKKGFYLKASIQRSTNPLGNAEEVMHNGIGLRFSQPNAKALYIGEVGIKRAASFEARSLWVRAGYMYNTSPYQRFTGGTSKNQAVYALVDYQLTRPDGQKFFRGLYVGASAEAATKSVNVFTRSAEGRAYYIGPIASRPFDALNFSITYNRYSNNLYDANLLAGIKTERYQLGTAVGYAIHAGSGVTISPAFQYIVHPTFLPDYRNAVIGALSVFLAV